MPLHRVSLVRRFQDVPPVERRVFGGEAVDEELLAAERAKMLRFQQNPEPSKGIARAMSNNRQAEASPPKARVMSYCYTSMGIGHLRRTLSITGHLSSLFPQASFLVTSGAPYASTFPVHPRLDFLNLPALTKVGRDAYEAKYLPIPFERLLRCRESILLAATQKYEPDVLLIDKAPAGVCAELMPSLRWLRRHRPQTRIVFGMRDIEDTPEATIEQWSHPCVQEAFEECFDEIWVYGMQDLFDVAAKYELSPTVQRKLRYVGYVVGAGCAHDPAPTNGTPNILVTVGGGTDGERLLATYLAEAAVRAGSLGTRSIVVGGPDLPPAATQRLREVATRIPTVEWHDCAPCMPCAMRRANLVVSMGGYNTLCEVVSHRKPVIVVPDLRPRDEQAIRGRLWAKRGLVEMVEPDEFTAPLLADKVVRALANGSHAKRDDLDLNGLARIGDRFGELLREVRQRATSVRL